MLNAAQITTMQDNATCRWHEAGICQATGELLSLAIDNHQANFDLWHEEDKARDPLASDAEMACLKHRIDQLNQRRNDLIEAMDDLLLRSLPQQNDEAPLHSETPGMMIDRLSILALKIYHTREEAERSSATPEHRQRNAQRLLRLEDQRCDLTLCLDCLWNEVRNGKRRFKLYRHMKMYNDPELNPAVYTRKGCS